MNKSTRSLLGMVSLLLAFANQFMALVLASIGDDILEQVNIFTITHYLGLLFGAVVFPAGIRALLDKAKTGFGKIRFAGLILVAATVFTAPAAKLFGMEVILSSPLMRFLMLFGIGLMSAPSYCLFFNQVPKRRQGLALGLAVGFALVVCRFSVPAAGNIDTPDNLPFLYDIHSLVLVAHAFLLLILIAEDGYRLFLPTRLFAEEDQNTAKPSLLPRLLGAVCMVYLLNGILDGMLYRFVPAPSHIRLHALSIAAIVFCPLFGLALDNFRDRAFHAIMLACSFLFMLSPALAMAEYYGQVYHALLLLATLSYYAFFITMTCILSGMGRSWWFCLPIVAAPCFRLVSLGGVFALNRFGRLDQGVSVLIAIVAAVVLYLLVKDIRISDPESAPTLGNAAAFPPAPDIAGETKENATDLQVLLRSSFPALSPREYEVAEWIVKGAGTREIAQHLAISENTVKVHVKKILDKYNLPSRKAFIARAISRRHHFPPKRA